jgi:hypothetical protein
MKALADLYHAAAVFILETLKKRKVGVVALKSSHGGSYRATAVLSRSSKDSAWRPQVSSTKSPRPG